MTRRLSTTILSISSSRCPENSHFVACSYRPSRWNRDSMSRPACSVSASVAGTFSFVVAAAPKKWSRYE
jgi:hypothetical protein